MGLLNRLLGGDEWRDKPKDEQRADIIRHKASKEALEQFSERERRRGNHDESPTYNQLNAGVIDAERDVPWWRL